MKCWGSGANGQEKILGTSSMQKKHGFITAWDRTLGQKELHWGCGVTDYILQSWEGVRDRVSL